MTLFFKQRNIALEEFPNLFAMEGHTGGFGALFAFIWFYFSYQYFPNIWGSQLIALAILIGAAFFLLLWASFALSSRYSKQINELRTNIATADPEKEDLEVWGRRWITLLSTGYVITCCFLIWLTGGTISPFTPFFVMIFTLTIARIKVPFPGFIVLACFLLAILVACSVAEVSQGPIDRGAMAQIQTSRFQSVMHFVFICASLIVPTLSKYFVELKERRNKQASGGEK